MADPSSTAVLGFAATWFTPTSLFLLLNLVIGTIFITSRFTTSTKHHQDDHHHESAPIARAPSSLIDRVKSINFSLYKFDHHPLQPDSYYQQQQYSESDQSHHVDSPPPLARAPSVLERLRSMNFWHHHEEPEHVPEPEYSTPIDRPPSLLHRLKSINVSSYWNEKPDPQPEPVTRNRSRLEPPPLARAPSFLARVKSINFSLYGPENSYPEEETDLVHEAADHHVKRVNSDAKPSGKKLPAKMKKSASDKSAFGHFGQEEEDDVAELRRPKTVKEGRKKGASAVKEAEEIDTKADDFINKFRQQLQLQRLDSIMRYKELITRTHENHQ